jgi:hypothetical protein
MDIKDTLKTKYSLSSIDEVQVKKGVHVYQVTRDRRTYYLKYFADAANTNEIRCYEILSKTDIPLIEYHEITTTSILLEDMTKNEKYRLGCKEDFVNNEVIKSIADWYKRFHIITKKNGEMFEFLEEDKILFSCSEVNECVESYGDTNFFSLLKENFTTLNSYLDKREKVVIHDDFYYKNFFVNKDTLDVVIFDFNFMKRGLISQEFDLIRRNLKSGSNKSESLFVKEYGSYDELEFDVFSCWGHLSCLHESINYEEKPDWSFESIKLLKNGELEIHLNKILSKLHT